MDMNNILLVVLDSVRAKNCSLYDHKYDTTPFLSEFSQEEATVFSQARAPSIRSISSHVSIFTGLHASEHNINRNDSYVKPDSTIWKELEGQGYSTAMFSPNSVITEASNLGDIFNKCVGPQRTRLFPKSLHPKDIQGDLSSKEYIQHSLNQRKPVQAILNGVYMQLKSGTSHDPQKESAEFYINELIKWVDDRSEPWAACVNLMDAHWPYLPVSDSEGSFGGEMTEKIEEIQDKHSSPASLINKGFQGDLRMLEVLYDACLRELDQELERLIDSLKNKGYFDNTLIIITSDHGEGFGEKSMITPDVHLAGHLWGIDEVLTHVPLVVKEPEQQYSRKISNLASLTKFPSVARAAQKQHNVADEFIPDEGMTYCSAISKLPKNFLTNNKRKKYAGPWKAVYKETDKGIIKYSKRNGDDTIIKIDNPQSYYLIDSKEKASSIIDNEFNKMGDEEIQLERTDDDELASDVEERLEELGYLTR